MNSEEAFLFATFKEFYKCWRSGTKARVIIESVNGKAFVNFSAFLGDPYDVHFKPRPSKRNPSKRPRKKSDNKIKRDNQRAAQFQERKRREEEEASALTPADNPKCEAIASSTALAQPPPVTDSSPLSNSTPSKDFKFSEPTRENMSGLNCSDIMNLDGNVTLGESSQMSRCQDVKEGAPNTQENAGKGVATLGITLSPRLTACVQEMLLRRQAFKDLALHLSDDAWKVKGSSKQHKALAGKERELQQAIQKLEFELRSLPLPEKWVTPIFQHMKEASSIEDAVHGYEDILRTHCPGGWLSHYLLNVQRHEEERMKKESSSSKNIVRGCR